MLSSDAELSLQTSQHQAGPCCCWQYILQGCFAGMQRPCCWGIPGILRAAQYGHLSTSVGQTSQNSDQKTHSLQESSRAANCHLPFPEIHQPLSLARRGQTSPVSVEKKLPLLFFGESATQSLPQVQQSVLRSVRRQSTLVITNR